MRKQNYTAEERARIERGVARLVKELAHPANADIKGHITRVVKTRLEHEFEKACSEAGKSASESADGKTTVTSRTYETHC